MIFQHAGHPTYLPAQPQSGRRSDCRATTLPTSGIPGPHCPFDDPLRLLINGPHHELSPSLAFCGERFLGAEPPCHTSRVAKVAARFSATTNWIRITDYYVQGRIARSRSR